MARSFLSPNPNGSSTPRISCATTITAPGKLRKCYPLPLCQIDQSLHLHGVALPLLNAPVRRQPKRLLSPLSNPKQNLKPRRLHGNPNSSTSNFRWGPLPSKQPQPPQRARPSKNRRSSGPNKPDAPAASTARPKAQKSSSHPDSPATRPASSAHASPRAAHPSTTRAGSTACPSGSPATGCSD